MGRKRKHPIKGNNYKSWSDKKHPKENTIEFSDKQYVLVDRANTPNILGPQPQKIKKRRKSDAIPFVPESCITEQVSLPMQESASDIAASRKGEVLTKLDRGKTKESLLARSWVLLVVMIMVIILGVIMLKK